MDSADTSSSSKTPTRVQRMITNKNVSQRPRNNYSAYIWKEQTISGRRKLTKPTSSKSKEFMGCMYIESNGVEHIVDKDKLYCYYCHLEQSNAEIGHFSKIYNTSCNTATGNHLNHARIKHNKTFETDTNPKITQWFNKKDDDLIAASSQYEFNRDITYMVAEDLLPFNVVEGKGFVRFISKNTEFACPSRRTISGTALVDIYCTLKANIINNILSTSTAATLMMDGWTDKHKRRPYFAIRASVIHDWTFKIITLEISPVETHTSRNLARYTKTVITEFFRPHTYMFNTTDGASNMKLMSTILGHERTHCVGHQVHLLLTVDSLNKIPQVVQLIDRCKEVVHTLHFKTYLLDQVKSELNEVELFETLVTINELLESEEQFANDLEDDDEDSESIPPTSPLMNTDEMESQPPPTEKAHTHSSLKSSVPTRWNSIIYMLDSIIQLEKAMNESLKRIGKFDMVIDADEMGLIKDLSKFLTPFKSLTDVVSQNTSNLSSIPLIRKKITKICADTDQKFHNRDIMKKVANLVLKGLDKRIEVTHLVKQSVCFDPMMRDLMLTTVEVQSLLKESYDQLMESSSSKLIFENRSVTSKRGKENDDGKCSELKKLRQEMADEMRCNVDDDDIDLTDVMTEIKSYSRGKVDNDMEPLDFWKNNERHYPTLAAMARVFLCINAGSVSVECMFSSVGHMLNGKRSCMAPYRVNMMSFVHDNVKLSKQ